MKLHFTSPASCMLIFAIFGASIPVSEGLEPQPGGKQVAISFATPTKHSIALSAEVLQKLWRTVLRRCALALKLDQNSLPWYFYYGYGVALLDAGDANHSLEALQMGANLKEHRCATRACTACGSSISFRISRLPGAFRAR